MRRSVLLIALAGLLVLPASAGAATFTVDPSAAPGCTGTTCKTLTAAAAQGTANQIDVKPGTYTESPMFSQTPLVVRHASSSPGLVRVDGAVTYTSPATGGSFTLTGLAITPTAGNTTPVTVAGPALISGTAAVVLQSDTLVANGTGTGVVAPGGALGSTQVTAHHVTIIGAPAVTLGSAGVGTSAMSVDNSIVHGATPGSGYTPSNVDTNTANSQLFVDPAAKDFHLLANAPVIDQGGSSESALDPDGDARPSGVAVDQSGDEFVDRPPVAVGNVSKASAAAGEALTFDGSGSSDPDVGDSLRYAWDYGDGTIPALGPAVTQHAYAVAGTFSAKLYVVDRAGTFAAGDSIPITVTGVPGGAGGGGPGGGGAIPSNGVDVAFTAPVFGATVKSTKTVTKKVHYRRHGKRRTKRKRVKVAVPLSLKGTDSAASGVKTVQLGLVLPPASGDSCRWFDGRAFQTRSCVTPLLFSAILNDKTWSFTMPKSAKVPPGQYIAVASATDFGGLISSAPALTSFTLVK